MKSFGEKVGTNGKRTVNDLGAGMTDNQRMEEFAHTGDTAYVIGRPDLMTRLGIQVDASGMPHSTLGKSNYEIEDEVLASFGANNETLAGLPLKDRVWRLLDIAMMRAKKAGSDEEFAKEIAVRRLYEALSAQPMSVAEAIFVRTDPTTIKTLALVPVLEALYQHTQDEVANLRIGGASPKVYLARFKELSLPFSDAARKAWDRAKNDPDAIFLVRSSLFPILFHIGNSDENVRNSRTRKPFELTEGRFAVLSDTEDRIYLAPADIYEVIRQNPDSQESYEMILDQGMPIDESMFVEAGRGVAQVTLDEFILVSHPEVRNLISFSFGVDITKLTLREQLHFLSFLKTVRVREAEDVERFTTTYNEKGLKTFLALAHKPQLGESIVAFGTARPEFAKRVFAQFGSIAQAADDVAQFIGSHIQGEHTAALADELAERFRRRGAEYLEAFIKKGLGSAASDAELLRELDQVRTSVILYTTATRLLAERVSLRPKISQARRCGRHQAAHSPIQNARPHERYTRSATEEGRATATSW
ncbi:MAG: hypothetical protein AAB421_05260 [Patescibacteria group bacterium]